MSKYQQELHLASDIVSKATEITEWFRKTGFKTILKKDHSPVTLADYASQIFINYHIKKKFPSDQLFAEEHTEGLSDLQRELIRKCYQELNIRIKDFKSNLNYRGNLSVRQWTIDPVDGTKGFVKDLHYSIGIGLLVNSNPVVSAIAAPIYDDKSLAVFIAEQGQGAKVSFDGGKYQSIKVSSQKNVKKARVCISLHNVSKATVEFLDKIGIDETNRLPMDGMGKFCKVADGSCDFYIHLNRSKMYSWDYCPGDLLVREAQGISQDIMGNKLIFRENECVITAPCYIFSNHYLYQELCSLF